MVARRPVAVPVFGNKIGAKLNLLGRGFGERRFCRRLANLGCTGRGGFAGRCFDLPIFCGSARFASGCRGRTLCGITIPGFD